MNVEELKDREELREFLMNDRLASANLLGNLDPAYFRSCRVFGTRGDDSALSSLIMLYKGLALPVLFMAGKEEDAMEIISAKPFKLPTRFHFHASSSFLNELEEHYRFAEKREMIRMGLHREDYQPANIDVSHVRQLGHQDTAAIIEIYQYYPDHLFEPYQLELGYYYGIDGEDGELQSIAGVHVYSEEYDIALIGNFVTRPSCRGEGYASACASKLLDALLKKVSYVALNVPCGNEAAYNLFTKFGFRKNNHFLEGVVNLVD